LKLLAMTIGLVLTGRTEEVEDALSRIFGNIPAKALWDCLEHPISAEAMGAQLAHLQKELPLENPSSTPRKNLDDSVMIRPSRSFMGSFSRQLPCPVDPPLELWKEAFTSKSRSRVVFIVSAVFLGAFGIHHFYRGSYLRGFFQLSWTMTMLIVSCLSSGLSLFCCLPNLVWGPIEAFWFHSDSDGQPFA
jgi:TM2 domain-containing membrane protein YozV